MFGAGKLKLRQGLESQLCRWIWYVIFVLGLIFAPVSIRHPLPVLGQSVRAGTAGCQAAGTLRAPREEAAQTKGAAKLGLHVQLVKVFPGQQEAHVAERGLYLVFKPCWCCSSS